MPFGSGYLARFGSLGAFGRLHTKPGREQARMVAEETEPHSGAFMRSMQAITTRDGARQSELCKSISALRAKHSREKGSR